MNALALILLLMTGPIAAQTGTALPSAYPDGLYAEVLTNRGLIVLSLEFEKTPMTVASFVGLAEGTIENAAFPAGTPFFDGTKWHRVVAGHVIQCGVPRNGKTQGPGYTFPNEIVLPELNHGRAGMVNMANGGPHTNSGQWCITLGDRSYLDGDYTVFGHVVSGLDAVMAVRQGDEVISVKIVRAGPKAQAFRPTTASFKAMVEEAQARVRKSDEEKKAREDAWIKAEWPTAVDAGNGMKCVVLREGRGEQPAPGAAIKASYKGKAPLSALSFVSTPEDGKPNWGETPEPFIFVVGKTRINAGLGTALATMKKGEKRIVIVPGALAYGTAGFYAAQRPNEKRFHISPDTLLVYEVERLD
jgi:cyclophilin family peptidyl-prolyl cis-trans isomerase